MSRQGLSSFPEVPPYPTRPVSSHSDPLAGVVGPVVERGEVVDSSPDVGVTVGEQVRWTSENSSCQYYEDRSLRRRHSSFEQ